MSTAERIKEQIAYLKLWLGILVVTGISLIGWLISNFDSATWPLILGGFVALVSIAFGCRLLHRKIEDRINQLEDL